MSGFAPRSINSVGVGPSCGQTRRRLDAVCQSSRRATSRGPDCSTPEITHNPKLCPTHPRPESASQSSAFEKPCNRFGFVFNGKAGSHGPTGVKFPAAAHVRTTEVRPCLARLWSMFADFEQIPPNMIKFGGIFGKVFEIGPNSAHIWPSVCNLGQIWPK